EVAAGSGNRAARADTGDEVGDAALGALPDLGAGGVVVAGRARRVRVLVGLPRVGRLAHEAVRGVVVRVGVAGGDGGGAHDDLGAVGLEGVALVLTDLVGAHEDARVAALLGDDREAHAGVAARGFDDDAAGLERAAGLGFLDHLQGDAVLGTAAGVEVLDLRDDLGAAGRHHRVQSDEGSVPDEVADVVRDGHGSTL